MNEPFIIEAVDKQDPIRLRFGYPPVEGDEPFYVDFDFDHIMDWTAEDAESWLAGIMYMRKVKSLATKNPTSKSAEKTAQDYRELFVNMRLLGKYLTDPEQREKWSRLSQAERYLFVDGYQQVLAQQQEKAKKETQGNGKRK